MRIYVDMDDVLCETAVSLCELAKREFSRDVDYANVSQFDLQQTFDLSDAEMRRFRELSHLPEILTSFAETPGAVDGVRALLAAGHSVDIVTGRPASSHVGTESWLKVSGLGDLAVVYVDKYNRIDVFAHAPDEPPTVSVADLARRGYDVAIDDSPLALDMLAAWRDTRVLVFDRPWNETVALAANMRRVDGWDAVLAQIKEM